MAAPRLPFLYPNFLRAVRSCEPSHRSFRFPASYTHNRNRNRNHSPTPRSFHTSRRRDQEAYQKRYGPAVEPDLPPPSKPDESTSEKDKPEQSQSQSQPESQSQRQSEEETADTASESETKQTQPEESASSDLEAKEEPTHEEANVSASSEPESEQQQPPQEQPDTQQQQQQPNLLDHVLHMPSPSNGLMPTRPHPSSHGDNYNNPPHLTPGPYVHHFDTYSLVRDLGTGGFSDEQSITIMKAVRQLLHNNLDLAKDSLISKSDVENESYLFKAACSELQSSLQTSRNSEMQTQRASRTQIQHESDILSQRLNQELSGLKDDIKGMFNDHKMSTREQQRSIDTSVQELNYKITVSLNSDGKSEIEGLRWILTRRAAFAIAISAAMIIAFLKYNSVERERKIEEAQKPKEQPVKEQVEPRAAGVRETAHETGVIIPEAHVSESLG